MSFVNAGAGEAPRPQSFYIDGGEGLDNVDVRFCWGIRNATETLTAAERGACTKQHIEANVIVRAEEHCAHGSLSKECSGAS